MENCFFCVCSAYSFWKTEVLSYNFSRNVLELYSVIGQVRFAINKRKRDIYNHGHNITRSFNVLPNFPFTTSETKPDY